MKNKEMLIKIAMASVFSLTSLTVASTFLISESAIAAAQDMEKCYGVAKSGMNDCHTATEACAGSAKKDNQADAFLLMPKGLCDKLVGGHLAMQSEDKK